MRLLFAAGLWISGRRVPDRAGAARLFGGLQFPNQVQNEIDWWIFAGRIAGGLNRNQQVDMFQRISQTLLPRGKKPQRVNSSLLREMWRTAASLELLPVSTRTDLGDALIKAKEFGSERVVVPVATGRAEAVLWSGQSGVAAGHCDAVDRGAAECELARGGDGFAGAENGRPDAGRGWNRSGKSARQIRWIRETDGNFGWGRAGR